MVLTVAGPDLVALQPWFAPERPGPLIYQHIVGTGVGRCRVDRWPDPQVVLAELPGGNFALRGDPRALLPGGLSAVTGLVEAPAGWLPVLRGVDQDTGEWHRLIATLPGTAVVSPPAVPAARLLAPADLPALRALPADSAWIHQTWGGPARLLAARVARGVVVDGQVVALAVPFYVGTGHEDIGVVTVVPHRGRGLAAACAGALVADIRARGRIPSWTTSPDNAASRAVAARLGFAHARDDVLYAVGVPVPG